MNEDFETFLPESFDPGTQEGTSFNVVPVGTYVAQVTDACVMQPQSGDGYYVKLTWQITEGEYEGRYVWQNITFLHSKTQAVTIGRQQFKDLCIATGISEQVTDVEIFKYIPCRLKVGIEKDKQGVYSDKNRVSRILPLEPKDPTPAKATPKPAPGPTSAAATTAPTVAAKPTGAAGNGPTAPWRKQKPSVGEEIGDEVPY